jgi:hypothetical protein
MRSRRAVVAATRVDTAPDDARPVDRLSSATHRPERLGGWAVPMPTVDPLIVLRSARTLPGYGRLFVYGHFAHLRRTATLVAGGLASARPRSPRGRRPGGRRSSACCPRPARAPMRRHGRSGRFTVLLVGTAHGEREEDDVRIVARVRGGDPGYGETSRMLAEAALTLASDERPDVVGVVTPAVGLGLPYQRRLEASGMRFEVVEVGPRERSPLDAPPFEGVIYQVYPRSFRDADGDGVGDVAGIRAGLDHLSWLGIDAVWSSPLYRSPMADFGYDVADHCDVDPVFGTLADLDGLIADAEARGIQVWLDFVPNHTSDRTAGSRRHAARARTRTALVRVA